MSSKDMSFIRDVLDDMLGHKVNAYFYGPRRSDPYEIAEGILRKYLPEGYLIERLTKEGESGGLRLFSLDDVSEIWVTLSEFVGIIIEEA